LRRVQGAMKRIRAGSAVAAATTRTVQAVAVPTARPTIAATAAAAAAAAGITSGGSGSAAFKPPVRGHLWPQKATGIPQSSE